MRSADEIRFRLRQELANAGLALFPPGIGRAPDGIAAPLAGLPDPLCVAARLRHTGYAREVLELAQQIAQRRIPALALTLEVDEPVRWRKDYAGGRETSLRYFRRIPYLDPARAGDHKIIWELNRHQHLVLLAQAHLIDPRPNYAGEIRRQLDSWMDANPFQRGINWTSALEVAFRALSWIWLYHLVGREWSQEFRRRFLTVLNQHGYHLEYNLSVYFSPNTHLLGEALALYALGRLMPALPRAKRWESLGGEWVRREMLRQVLDDGAHFEQSAYYHVYAADMFLFFAVLAREPGPAYLQRLHKIAEYLAVIMGPSRKLPFLGDDDGGRFFYPFGPRTEFARATLAACGAHLNQPCYIAEQEDLCPIAAWWLGPQVFGLQPGGGRRFESKLFPDTGLAVLFQADRQLIFDVGGFGPGSAGHSHSDTLSILVRRGDEEILIDPGTYTYVGDPDWRNRFRGSAFHNTVVIDGQNQAATAGPFSWSGRPSVSLIRFESNLVEALCRYSGIEHRRRVDFTGHSLISVVDEISGPPGKHDVAWHWHFGIPARQARERIELDERSTVNWEEGGQYGWRSTALGIREPAPAARASIQSELPLEVVTRFHLD